MSGILGFTADQPQPLNHPCIERALRLLEGYGACTSAMLFFNDFRQTRSFLDGTGEHPHSINTSPSPSELATAMLAYCHFSSGNQCGQCSDSPIFLACDGTVDNAPALSAELRYLGHDVGTTSQVDVLLAAFDQWGPDCLSQMTGSFAMAVIDVRRNKLILARDAFGTRPLYYARPNSNCWFFASRIGALLEMTSLARKINRASLYRYLAYNMMDHGAETFFAGVSQVAPGHYLEVSLDSPVASSLIGYRHAVPAGKILRFDEAVERVRGLVIRSVESHVRGQNAVGAALSGGFDSSFVTAALEQARPGAPLDLYTCIPVVKNGDFVQSEEGWADLAATALHARLNKIWVGSADLPACFPFVVSLQEEPFSSPVVFAQLQLFRAAQKNGVRLMLSGQGGDTIFATSTEQLLRAVFTQARRGHWGEAAALLRGSPHTRDANAGRIAFALARTVAPEGLQAFARRLRQAPRLDWLKKSWFRLNSDQPPRDFGLPMLRFEDRNSNSCSLLNRMPLLTVELQDFVGSLPAEFLVRANQPIKSIESAAMKGMVPDAILERRERFGFPVPVREWLIELASWVDTIMADIERFPFLDPRRVRQIWDGVRSNDESVRSAFLIWRLVFLAGWNRFLNVRLD